MTANAALQAAQKMPSASQNPDVTPPQIAADSDLAAALSDGRQELFQIELFDCCDEDGDIVEVHRQRNVVRHGSHHAWRHDAVDPAAKRQQHGDDSRCEGRRRGVTLSFRTSRGEYFARSMRVGEQYQMEVVVR